MASKDFVPKVRQLEQIKVEFDDANAIEGAGALPISVQSAKKFDVGPTNNSRMFQRKRGAKGAAPRKTAKFGFIDRHSHASDNAYEEEKEKLTAE